MENQQNKFNREHTFMSEKGEKAHKEYMKFMGILNVQPSISAHQILEDLKNQMIFQEFARNEKSVKALFDQASFRALYVTGNVEDLHGYTTEEWSEHNVALLFNSLIPEHIVFPMLATQINILNIETIPLDILLKNKKIIYCGMKVRHKNQSIIQILMKYLPLEFDENGFTKMCMVIVENVSHLMKPDFNSYWGRISFGDNQSHKQHFISDVGTRQLRDIVSDREKDVLRLIAQGLESKEIGKQLFISSGTVDMHRRNMISRTGARDTTALVQLCLSCGII